MAHLQGAIVDEEGQRMLRLHVRLRVSGTKWTGTFTPSVRVTPDNHPRQGAIYRLRLDDGRERNVIIDHVSVLSTGTGLSFRADFTATSPPASPQGKVPPCSRH